jgi:GNAT superfamily N-acetyltransferase
MDTIRLRRALPSDAPLIAEMRIRSTRERHLSDADVASFRPVCEERFERGLASGELRSWLAFDGAQAVGTATLMLVPNLPRLGIAPGPDARVRNVYVEPAYRGRGIAQAMLREILAEAKELGVDRLTLGASELGRGVYAKLGFVAKEDEMIFALGSLREGVV